MAVPNFQELMLPLLQLCEESDKDVKSYVDGLARAFELTDDDIAETIPSGKQTVLKNRAQWAATYLSKAELLDRPMKGVISLTNKGRLILEKNPKFIDNEFLMQFPSFVDFKTTKNEGNIQSANSNQSEESISTPEDTINTAFLNYAKATKEEILDLILDCSPNFFELLIIDLFKAMGYGGKGKSFHNGKTGDGGIDGIINEDPLGLEKIYLQAKRYAPDNKINIDQIRSFSGSLHERGARKGIFVTTSSFVSSAYDYADRNPQSLILIDGDELTKLMYQYDVGVRTVDTIKLKKPDIDYFEEV